ncbi:MAG: ribonuclease P protein component [Bacteroidales bacterium]|nr:ribonuclease P protein component [Bacteroidales bacterium]
MQTFKKEERLSNHKTIEKLFSQGNSFFLHPFKVIWLDIEVKNKYPAQILISVSKKNFRKAVDRNLIKRRIREAYRKNKSQLYEFLEHNNIFCVFAFLYVGKDIIKYKEIEQKIILILQRLVKEHEKLI